MNLELFINQEFIEIDDKVIAPLTYSIADVKNPEKRARNRSKSIKVKGTQNNMRAMFSAYSLSLEDAGVGFDFNPNAQLPAVIKRNGYVVFNGVAQFKKVTIKKGAYFFDFQLFGNSVGLFESLGDMTLADLGWDEYNHNLTIANLELTWDTSVDVNGVPTSNFTVGVPDGFGYLYPLINYGYAYTQTDPRTNELIPYFYVIEALEKCLAVGGYTMIGAWKSQQFTKRMLFGQGGGERIGLTAPEVAARQVNYTIAGNDNNNLPPFVQRQGSGFYIFTYNYNKLHQVGDIGPLATTLVQDTRTQFVEAGGVVTISATGNYNLQFLVDMNITLAFVGGSPTYANATAFMEIWITVNGAANAVNTGSAITATGSHIEGTQAQRYFVAGDEVRFFINPRIQSNLTTARAATLNDAPTLDFNWSINTASFDITSTDVLLLEGDLVEIGKWMPNIKCRDFVKDLITMNNLYLSDPNDDNEIRIEPFDDYYNPSNLADNWTMKLNHEQDIVIEPNAGIEGKVYKYKFAEDRDAWKQLYYNQWGTDYGDFEYTVPSTFKKGEKVYKVGFAQTVPVDVYSAQAGGNLIIPQIVTRDPQTGLDAPYKGKPRMFLYNGLITGAWRLRDSTTGAYTNEPKYPQVHHVDNVANPTFDLNFGVPTEIYYTATKYTTANLFNMNYATQIKELTSKDSKFLTAYFKINEQDLQGEFMRDLVNINGVVYRKNKIQDFDATGYKTTKVELIKLLAPESNSTSTTDYNAGGVAVGTGVLTQPPVGSTGGGTDPAPTIDGESSDYYVADSSSSAIAVTMGDEQRNGAQRTIIRDGANEVTIQAATGDISGQSEIVLANDGDSVTLVYFVEGGYRINSEVSGLGGAQNVDTITASQTADIAVDVYLVDTSGGDVTLTLPVVGTTIGKTWDIKKVDALNTLTIIGGLTGGGFPSEIDGVDEGLEVPDLNTSYTIQYSATDNFKIL
jgi:hypothetical protein